MDFTQCYSVQIDKVASIKKVVYCSVDNDTIDVAFIYVCYIVQMSKSVIET